jgi:hypothetical protein
VNCAVVIPAVSSVAGIAMQIPEKLCADTCQHSLSKVAAVSVRAEDAVAVIAAIDNKAGNRKGKHRSNTYLW